MNNELLQPIENQSSPETRKRISKLGRFAELLNEARNAEKQVSLDPSHELTAGATLPEDAPQRDPTSLTNKASRDAAYLRARQEYAASERPEQAA